MVEGMQEVDAQLARLTDELDKLTEEFQAAQDARFTPAGEKTGMERIADALTKASQLTREKDTLKRQRPMLEQYATHALVYHQSLAQQGEYRRLIARAQALVKEAAKSEQETGKNADWLSARRNNTAQQLLNQGITHDWMNAIEHSLQEGKP